MDMNSSRNVILSTTNSYIILEFNKKNNTIDTKYSNFKYSQYEIKSKDSYYINDSTLIIGYNFDGSRIQIYDLIHNTNYFTPINLYNFRNLKLDNEGIIFTNYFNTISKISIEPFTSTSIIDSKNRILNYFVYDSTHNYIVTELGDLKDSLVEFNSKNGTILSKELLPFKILNNEFIVLNNGSILYEKSGLYKYFKGQSKSIQYDPNSVNADIKFIVKTKSKDLLMQTDTGFYYSIDDGDSWIYIKNLTKNLPLNIDEFIAFDSTYAVAMATNEDTGQKLYVYDSKFKGWIEKILDEDSRCFSNIIIYKDFMLAFDEEVSNNTLFMSKDMGKSWKKITYFGDPIVNLIKTKEGLIGVSENSFNHFLTPITFNESNESWIALNLPNNEVNTTWFNRILSFENRLVSYFIRPPVNLGYPDSLIIAESIDNGLNWKFLSREQYVNDDYINWLGFDKVNNRIVQHAHAGNRVRISNDFGNSFNEIEQLNFFSNVFHVYSNLDSSYFLVGQLPNKAEIKLYKSNFSFNNFEEINIPKLKYDANLNIQKYPLIVLYSIEGLWYSPNAGLDWIPYDLGLPKFPENLFFYTDFNYLEDQRGLISLCKDGLYTTMWPVQTKSIIEIAKLPIYPNPTLDEFQVNLQGNKIGLTFTVYDGQGKLIQSLNKMEGMDRFFLVVLMPQEYILFKFIIRIHFNQ